MLKAPIIASAIALMALSPSYAQDKSEWCTDAHMQEMDAQLAKITDATKKQEAETHLQQSKDAMQKGDTEGCIKHMEEAHKAMGM